jgi:hypothetical protein
LRRTLARAAGPGEAAGDAWTQLTPRLRRARRRNRAAIVGASLLVIGGISAVALATDPMEQRSQVIVPAGRPGDSTSTTRVTSASTPTGGSATTTMPAPGATSARPGPDAGPEGTAGETSAPAAGETTPATTATTAPDETQTYVAPGGRATVRFAGGALTLVDFSANPGYTAEVQKAETDDVEVRFRPAAGAESRIRVRIENGSVSSETE